MMPMRGVLAGFSVVAHASQAIHLEQPPRADDQARESAPSGVYRKATPSLINEAQPEIAIGTSLSTMFGGLIDLQCRNFGKRLMLNQLTSLSPAVNPAQTLKVLNDLAERIDQLSSLALAVTTEFSRYKKRKTSQAQTGPGAPNLDEPLHNAVDSMMAGLESVYDEIKKAEDDALRGAAIYITTADFAEMNAIMRDVADHAGRIRAVKNQLSHSAV